MEDIRHGEGTFPSWLYERLDTTGKGEKGSTNSRSFSLFFLNVFNLMFLLRGRNQSPVSTLTIPVGILWRKDEIGDD